MVIGLRTIINSYLIKIMKCSHCCRLNIIPWSHLDFTNHCLRKLNNSVYTFVRNNRMNQNGYIVIFNITASSALFLSEMCVLMEKLIEGTGTDMKPPKCILNNIHHCVFPIIYMFFRHLYLSHVKHSFCQITDIIQYRKLLLWMN